MTARSERRDREMAVIDAAVNIVVASLGHGWLDTLSETSREARSRLTKAVGEYSKHELAEPSTTRTNLLSPETAHEAEGFAKRFALTDAGEVFRRIYYAYRSNRYDYDQTRHTVGGPIGLTSDQLEAMMERTHQSISARVNALKNAGWIIDSGERRKTRSDRNAIVWTPTAAAVQFVLDRGLPIPVTRMEMTVEPGHGRG